MALCLVLCLPFLAAFALCIWRGSTVQRVAALGVFSGAVIVYCASVFQSPRSFYDYATMSADDLNSPWLSRYGVVPSMMLCALIPLGQGAVRGCEFRAAEPHPKAPDRMWRSCGRSTVPR